LTELFEKKIKVAPFLAHPVVSFCGQLI